MKYRIAQHTDVGARQYNQDRCGWTKRENALLLVLADGLGGYRDGHKAAQVFTDTVIDSFDQFKQKQIPDPLAFIVLSTIHGHRMVNRMAKAAGHNEATHPRTTSVVCIIQHGYAYWGHVGDSRLYMFRNGAPYKRTEDHTTTEQLRRDGSITEDEMRLSENQGPLLRCVGGKIRPVVTLSPEVKLESDDYFLLCSDGLWRAHSSNELAATLTVGDLTDRTRNLVTESVRIMNRHSDNVTGLSLRWDETATTRSPLNPPNYTGPQQIQLWEEQWQKARIRRKKRQALAARDGFRFDDEFLDEEIEEMDQALSELESFVTDSSE